MFPVLGLSSGPRRMVERPPTPLSALSCAEQSPRGSSLPLLRPALLVPRL